MLTYVDSSVALAHLFREPRAPSASFWLAPTISSRLLEYEIWNRLHAHDRAVSHGAEAQSLLSGIELLELHSWTLSRAFDAFPVAVRTLDGLHLATIEFLRGSGESVELASYDRRLAAAAEALGIPLTPL